MQQSNCQFAFAYFSRPTFATLLFLYLTFSSAFPPTPFWSTSWTLWQFISIVYPVIFVAVWHFYYALLEAEWSSTTKQSTGNGKKKGTTLIKSANKWMKMEKQKKQNTLAPFCFSNPLHIFPLSPPVSKSCWLLSVASSPAITFVTAHTLPALRKRMGISW